MSDNYEVGYKKPPKHSQFKKGQTGNARGRPKKARPTTTQQSPLYAMFLKLLRKEVTVMEEGKSLKMSKLEVIAMRHINAAATGSVKDLKALLTLVEMAERWEAQNVPRGSAMKGPVKMPSDAIEAERMYREMMG